VLGCGGLFACHQSAFVPLARLPNVSCSFGLRQKGTGGHVAKQARAFTQADNAGPSPGLFFAVAACGAFEAH